MQSDPLGALLYASSGDAMKSAEFQYDMVMTMEPADEAAEEALGPAAGALAGFTMTATGTGAMEIVDAAAMKNKMRMQLDMEAAGEQIQMEMVMIEDTVWCAPVRMRNGRWQGGSGWGGAPGGMDERHVGGLYRRHRSQWIEDAELNGESVSHLHFTVDPAKFDMSALTSTLGEDLRLRISPC